MGRAKIEKGLLKRVRGRENITRASHEKREYRGLLERVRGRGNDY